MYGALPRGGANLLAGLGGGQPQQRQQQQQRPAPTAGSYNLGFPLRDIPSTVFVHSCIFYKNG